MIKHIVMWKAKDSVEDIEEKLLEFKRRGEDLKKDIPEIVGLNIELNILKSDFSKDLVLRGEYKSLEDLKIYQEHKDHVALVEYGKDFLEDKVVIDFEF